MALAYRARRWHWAGIVLLGIISGALFYGDAVITPALSVLSAIEGFKVATAGSIPTLPVTVVILLALFAVQSRGTARVAAFFGPIMLLWFLIIGLPRCRRSCASPRSCSRSTRSTPCLSSSSTA